MSVMGDFTTPNHCDVARATVLLVHPMFPIELHQMPELLSGVIGIVPQETHQSNCNDSNSCECYCRDHKK